MIHGATLQVAKLTKEAVTVQQLASALVGFPYKFISPLAHKFYVEFDTHQKDDILLTDHLNKSGIIILELTEAIVGE